jgi:hypothetical protein
MWFNYKLSRIKGHIERSRNVFNQSSTTLRLTFSNLQNPAEQQVNNKN